MNLADAIAAFAVLILILGLVWGPQLMMLYTLRQIRLMAASLPEKDRERWLNEALTSLGKGLEQVS